MACHHRRLPHRALRCRAAGAPRAGRDRQIRPRSAARRAAVAGRDTAAVAAPVLEHSRLLLEDDILPVVLRGMTAHRLAVASRKLISGRVAEALCRAGERTVLLRLLANEGAAIPEAVLHSLLDRFPDQPAIADAIGRRRILPVSVSSRLFGVIPPRRGESVERPALRLVAERAASA